MSTNSLTELFGEVIYSYTRRQAIEDGVLAQLSGPGYEGDDWMPKMCREAGFKIPVAMTASVFNDCVSPVNGSKLAPCQDIEGRLWDVLWMLKCAIARGGNTDTIIFKLHVVPNIPQGSKKRNPRAELTTLKAVCGPDDDGSPCITIMQTYED